MTADEAVRAVENLHAVFEELKNAAPKVKAGFEEAWRKRRHHDVLCLVLGKYLDQHGVDEQLSSERVAMARAYADAAYPPPKPEDK